MAHASSTSPSLGADRFRNRIEAEAGHEDLARSGPSADEATCRYLHEYLQFLNHELRTPLTAALTALQIVVEEAEEAGGPDGPDHRFVGLALKNLRRLGKTLRWSEEYLSWRTEIAPPVNKTGQLEFLLTEAQPTGIPAGLLRFELEPGVANRMVRSDPGLLQVLLQQIWRAFQYHQAEIPVSVRVGYSRGQDGRPGQVQSAGSWWFLFATGHDSTAGASAPVVRVGLGNAEGGNEAEFRRLVDFSVSREILHSLRGRLETHCDRSGADPVVRLVLVNEVG